MPFDGPPAANQTPIVMIAGVQNRTQKFEDMPGYEDIFAKILEELPPRTRLVGLTPEERRRLDEHSRRMRDERP